LFRILLVALSGTAPPPRPTPPRTRRSAGIWSPGLATAHTREQLELAEGRWQDAIKEHAQPPPNAGYARRLRRLADAAAQEQAAYRFAEEQGFGWRSGRASLPPQELRDAPWRTSPAPGEAWDRLAEAVQALSRARTGVSVVAIAQAFGQLSAAAWDLADAVEQRQRQRGARAG
jgi:hypothetical protein